VEFVDCRRRKSRLSEGWMAVWIPFGAEDEFSQVLLWSCCTLVDNPS